MPFKKRSQSESLSAVTDDKIIDESKFVRRSSRNTSSVKVEIEINDEIKDSAKLVPRKNRVSSKSLMEKQSIQVESKLNDEKIDSANFVRRSSRAPSQSLMETREVKIILDKIRSNHEDTVVLKLKDFLRADITSAVLDEIIEALYTNKVCQALYVQNLSNAMKDKQLKDLIELLKKKKIWCLNIGENYSVTADGWVNFCKELPNTNITHLYVSEHTIKIELKNLMREKIRENRKKHDLHSSMKNIKVIERCTNMWWNPINAIRHALDPNYKPVIDTPQPEPEKKKKVIQLTPAHTAYWAEGYGEGGNKPWKFKCTCGETCSSYENYRYHPVGEMYECTRCSIWSHVRCMLGKMPREHVEELSEVLCNACKSNTRREKIKELRECGYQWINSTAVSIWPRPAAANADVESSAQDDSRAIDNTTNESNESV